MASTRPFEFQHFTVCQSRAAMKVGFDGVLLGAWAQASDGSILDVGTGTGLIALMAAQRTAASSAPIIDALEIEPGALLDAQENFRASPWSDRLRLHQCPLQAWRGREGEGYGSILCNPPFFQGSATELKRSLARHDSRLKLRDLCDHASGLLAAGGRLSVIVPTERLQQLHCSPTVRALHMRRTTFVRSLPGKQPHRVLAELSAEGGSCECDELTIENTHHQYSPEFRTLTAEFYIEDYQS